jgi:hypothetical protein
LVVTRKNILRDEDPRNKYISGVKLLKNDFLRPEVWPNTYDMFVYWYFEAMMFHTPPDQEIRKCCLHRTILSTMASVDACVI